MSEDRPDDRPDYMDEIDGMFPDGDMAAVERAVAAENTRIMLGKPTVGDKYEERAPRRNPSIGHQRRRESELPTSSDDYQEKRPDPPMVRKPEMMYVATDETDRALNLSAYTEDPNPKWPSEYPLTPLAPTATRTVFSADSEQNIADIKIRMSGYGIAERTDIGYLITLLEARG